MVACLVRVSVAAAAVRPNVVYILADDLGYGDVSCFDANSKIRTPNIDALAKEGMRFTDAHSGSAVCTPTRYGIMTGRYAWRTRLKKGVLNGFSEPLIEPGRETVAQFMAGQGYATACAGKWHLGLGWERVAGAEGVLNGKTVDFSKAVTSGPHTLGFGYSFILPASLDMPPYVYVENGKATELPTRRVADSPRPAMYRAGVAGTTFDFGTTLLEITRHAVAWVDGRAKDGKPFFLYVPLTAPHTPHVPRAEFQGKSGAGNYGDFVMETDWSVGEIVGALARNRLAENTLVIVTSDNGAHSEPLHLEQQYGHRANSIFRGQKSDAWDGGHHIPFVARWPGHVKAGTTCERTVSLVDLYATCAEILGAKVSKDAAEDSFSMLPLLEGKADAPVRPAVVMHSIDGYFAVKEGPWKLVLCKGSGGWTLPENRGAAGARAVQLYNTKEDPSEKVDLAEKRPEVVKKLEGVLEEFRRAGRSVGAGV